MTRIRLLIAAMTVVLPSCGGPSDPSPRPSVPPELPTIPENVETFFPIRPSGGTFGAIDSLGRVLVPHGPYSYCSMAFYPLTDFRNPFMGQRSLLLVGRKQWLFVHPKKSRFFENEAGSGHVRQVLNLGESLFRIECYKTAQIPTPFVFDPLGRWKAPDNVVPEYPFHEQKCVVKVDGQFTYADREGNLVMSERFERARSFSEGLAPVKRDGLWGYIDSTGRPAIAFQYVGVSHFSEGFALVKRPGQRLLSLIDRSGLEIRVFDEIRQPPDGGCFPGFYRGLVFVKVEVTPNGNEQYGFVDATGNWPFQKNLLRFSTAWPAFAEDHLILSHGEPMGNKGALSYRSRILHRNGEVGRAVPRAYWNPFVFGLAGDREGKEGYVDIDGNFVWRPN